MQVIGCQATNTKVMYESVKAGHIVHEESFDTLSDGTFGDIEEGTVSIRPPYQYEKCKKSTVLIALTE